MSVRLPLFLCFILFSLITTAQQSAEQQAIATRLAEYGRLTTEWKIDSLLEFIEPKMFEIVPRETMVQTFESVMADENMAIRFGDYQIKSISEPIDEAGTLYAPVEYGITVKMEMLSEDYQEADFMEMMASMMPGESAIDTASHLLTFRQDKMMFAIKHAPDEPWYFIEYKTDNIGMMDMLIPPAVRVRLDLD